MKKIIAIWLIVALFIMPCVLNLENGWCVLAVMVNAIASFIAYKSNEQIN